MRVAVADIVLQSTVGCNDEASILTLPDTALTYLDVARRSLQIAPNAMTDPQTRSNVMKTFSAVLLAAIPTLALSASALADFGGGPRGGFGPGGLGLGGPEMMLERMAEHIADRLDLDDTQRATVRNVLEAARPEFRALREQARANREALRALDAGDPAVNDIAVSNGELATRGTLLAHRVRNEVRAVLTEEQLEKFERVRDRMRDAAERRSGRR